MELRVEGYGKSSDEAFILLIDNYTGGLQKLYHYLLLKQYRVELVNKAAQAREYVFSNPVQLVVSQVTLLDSDLTVLEKELRSLDFDGIIVAVIDDPLVEKAARALNFKCQYVINDLKNLKMNEKLIKTLTEKNSDTQLANCSSANIEEVFRISIPSSMNYISRTIAYLEQRLSLNRELFQHFNILQIALVEALENAIEHGNNFDSKKMVRISLNINKERMILRVKDEGPGYNYRAHHKNAKNLNNGFNNRGRGLLIIKNAMDEVRFEAGGSTIIMTKKF